MFTPQATPGPLTAAPYTAARYTQKPWKITVRATQGIYEFLQAEAKRRGLPVSEVVREILEAHMANSK